MMGPIVYLQNHDGRIKRCSEKRLGCNTSENNTAGCCAIVACRYCVTWTEYGSDAVAEMTTDGDGIWVAAPGGIAFEMYWERSYETDDCELVVTFDGEEVYRKSCYEGQSCRDSSDEVEVSTAYLTGTLRWDKDLKRQLPTVRDYETNCIRQMCSGCNCTCECLCVYVTDSYGTEIATGELCDTAYDCDPVRWEGTVGDDDYVIAMDEDCNLTATVNGVEKSLVIAEYTTVCDNFTATITMDDGSLVTLSCKECTCISTDPYLCECRQDIDHTFLGTLVSGGSVCTINPSVGSLTPGSPPLVPPSTVAWLTNWCIYWTLVTYKRTADPPDCTDTITSKLIVLVKKTTAEDAPYIDNAIVGVEDWYAVVYNYDGTGGPDITYEYAQCCKNATPQSAASSHLIWVEFFNVALGDDEVWDYKWTNPTTLAIYGDC